MWRWRAFTTGWQSLSGPTATKLNNIDKLLKGVVVGYGGYLAIKEINERGRRIEMLQEQIREANLELIREQGSRSEWETAVRRFEDR